MDKSAQFAHGGFGQPENDTAPAVAGTVVISLLL
jgi:hypothetical protein